MKKILCFLPLLIAGLCCYAQEIVVKGVVVNKDNTPLEGVSVRSKSNVAITDAEGIFAILTFAGDELTFTYVGMRVETYAVESGASSIRIQMAESEDMLQDVVVTGY